ncbi:hypothetical protein, partial [Streptomyces lavendulocolor]|uniref:hypothetical protein n=1 Tax=Streptomyces lavendulocolor TaxID=67316 RepID=UPI003407A1BD
MLGAIGQVERLPDDLFEFITVLPSCCGFWTATPFVLLSLFSVVTDWVTVGVVTEEALELLSGMSYVHSSSTRGPRGSLSCRTR